MCPHREIIAYFYFKRSGYQTIHIFREGWVCENVCNYDLHLEEELAKDINNIENSVVATAVEPINEDVRYDYASTLDLYLNQINGLLSCKRQGCNTVSTLVFDLIYLCDPSVQLFCILECCCNLLLCMWSASSVLRVRSGKNPFR